MVEFIGLELNKLIRAIHTCLGKLSRETMITSIGEKENAFSQRGESGAERGRENNNLRRVELAGK